MKELDSPTIRDLLRILFPSSAKLDAFCIDYFPITYKTFSNGMDQDQKLNTILTEVSTSDILDAIRKQVPPEVLDREVWRVREMRQRIANPSIISSIKIPLLRRKSSILLILLLILMLCFGDTVKWRSESRPFIESLYRTDSSALLEESWRYFDQEKFDESLEKARCITFMYMSSDEQKRQAKMIIKAINVIQSGKSLDNELKRNLKYSALPTRATRLQELALNDIVPRMSPSRTPAPADKPEPIPPLSISSKPIVSIQGEKKGFDANRCRMVLGAMRIVEKGGDKIDEYYRYYPYIAQVLDVDTVDNGNWVDDIIRVFSRLSGLPNLGKRKLEMKENQLFSWHMYKVDPMLIEWIDTNIANTKDPELRSCIRDIYVTTMAQKMTRTALRIFASKIKGSKISQIDTLLNKKFLDEKATKRLEKQKNEICEGRLPENYYSSKQYAIDAERVQACENLPISKLTDECIYRISKSTLCGFWVRRYLDGSLLSIVRLSINMVKQYDIEFYQVNQAWLDELTTFAQTH